MIESGFRYLARISIFYSPIFSSAMDAHTGSVDNRRAVQQPGKWTSQLADSVTARDHQLDMAWTQSRDQAGVPWR
jgi:hypothetical protein